MRNVLPGLALAMAGAVAFAACGGSGSQGGPSPNDGGITPGTDGGQSNDGSPVGLDAAPFDGAVPPPPPPTCTPPIQPEPIASPTTVIGNGTAASCTESLLQAAVKTGGVITFNCGSAATIAITAQLDVSTTKDTVIDGGGAVTLDGGGKTRILSFNSPNFRVTKTKLAVQHITLANAKATGTPIPPASPPCSQGFKNDGGGAAIFIRDGALHVVDVTFTGNQAASPGPDVAGGGVYAVGALDVTIVGSRFAENSGSNGGAVGSLFSNLTLVNNTFSQNHATGTGANYIDSKCTVGGGESGDGGNGGAVVIDGGEDFGVSICGNVFSGNAGGALGGAVFRTPDNPVAKTTIDQSTFDGNSAKGGGALYFHHSDLVISASTFSNNSAEGAGAIQADDTNITFSNDTFTGNSATKSLGGALAIFSNGGTITNCTFAANHADAGSGIFGGAIAGAKFSIENTVFWNNTSKDAGAGMTCAPTGTGAGDVQWPQTHDVGGAPDNPCVTGITFADAKLDALKDNGGPTKTMAPLAGSAAAGVGKACPATDQRGKPRKTPDGCTAGAYELP